jgi:hypothetical protein
VDDELQAGRAVRGARFQFVVTKAHLASWEASLTPEQRRQVNWIVLMPADLKNAVLSTALGAAIAVRGVSSAWLAGYVRSTYPEHAESILDSLRRMENGENYFELPARPAPESYLERLQEERIIDIQA